MRGKNGGQGIVEYGLILGLCWVVILALVESNGPRTVSDGSRTGIVTGFSHSGIWYKTYEGDLLLGGQGTTTKAHWNFTVEDKVVVNQIRKAMDNQTLVELKYHEYLAVWPWNGDSRCFVTSVVLVNKPIITPTPLAQPER